MLFLSSEEYVGNAGNIRVLSRQPQLDYPEHCHDFSELVLVSSGSGTHIVNGKQSLLLPNSVSCISEKDYHQFTDNKDVYLVNVLYSKRDLHINQRCAQVIEQLEQQTCQFFITHDAFQPLFQLAQSIEREQEKGFKNGDVMITLLFEQLLLCIDRLDARMLENSPMMNAIVYLSNHYMEPDLSVGAVCEQFSIAAKSLGKEITRLTGLSTNKFINHLRIRHAMRELELGESVTEVAFNCGYTDSNYFSSKFKAVTGATPTGYLKQLQLQR